MKPITCASRVSDVILLPSALEKIGTNHKDFMYSSKMCSLLGHLQPIAAIKRPVGEQASYIQENAFLS